MEKNEGGMTFNIDPKEIAEKAAEIEASKTPEQKEQDRLARDWSREAIEQKNQIVDEVITKSVEKTKSFIDGNNGESVENADDLFEDALYRLTGGIISEPSVEFMDEARKRYHEALNNVH